MRLKKRVVLWVVFIFSMFFLGNSLALAQLRGTRVGCQDARGRRVPCDDPPSSRSRGGTSWEPVPSGPTPEELEQQRRQREATRLNQEAIELGNRGDYQGALQKQLEAAALDPHDRVIQDNVRRARANAANAEGITAFNAGNYELAARKFQEAINHYPDWGSIFRPSLENAQERQRREAEERERQRRDAEAAANIRQAINQLAGSLSRRPTTPDSGLGFMGLQPESRIGQPAAQSAGATPGLSFMGLEAFSVSNPPGAQASLATGQQQGQPGTNTSAGDQLMSAARHGAEARELAGQGAREPASATARLGFDTAGRPSGSLPALTTDGRSQLREPVIPPERRNDPKIVSLVNQRDTAKRERVALEEKLRKLEGRPQRTQETLVQIAKLRQEVDTAKNKEIYLNFSINEELRKPEQSSAR